MDKQKSEKKKKKIVSRPKRKLNKTEEESEKVVKQFDIPGVAKIILSPITQRAIGCVVNENVTTEEPWIYIKKEKIEDNLDLHEESSEFLPIKQDILEYPGNEILVGYDTNITEEGEEFFICVTTYARNTVLSTLEKEREEMQERLKKSIQKLPGQWQSLGSEKEVDENRIHNLRPLVEVEVESKYPLYEDKVKFSMRPVEAAVDGYVELVPGRFPITNVTRRRIDAATQASPDTSCNTAQTNPTFPTNMWTQYNFEYTEQPLDATETKQLANFINEKVEDICDTIRVNEFINLYTDDYKDLEKQTRKFGIISSRDIISFQDVVRCKGKKVSAVTWSPHISGLIAASYTRNPQNDIQTSESMVDQVNDVVHSENLVLIWSYCDTLLPKLYLQSHREIHSLSFCPTNANILIGGCSNGQIVVWDITNKLEEVETKEILTSAQQKHRVIMMSLIDWMKNIKDITLVYPTIVSAIDYSHRAKVTSIMWISPTHEVTRNGKIVEREEGEELSMQFFTCGMDSEILFWDLLRKPPGGIVPIRSQKKSARLPNRPPALSIDISRFRHLNKVFIPQFKIVVEDPQTRLGIPLTNISMLTQKLKFVSLNPETIEDIKERTYFKTEVPQQPFDFTNMFTVTSNTGRLIKCSWEGYDFDQGQKVNAEICQATNFLTVHDGPIRTLDRCPFFPSILLTVGGKVFAVWEERNYVTPVFWRKSKVRYVSGLWSLYHPGVLVIARADSYFEIWDLLVRSKSAGRCIRLSGNAFMDAYSDADKAHTRKNTFSTADSVGALRIYTLPPYLTQLNEEKRVLAQKILARIELRRSQNKNWLEHWKLKYLHQSDDQQTENPEVLKPKTEEKPEENEPEKSQEAPKRRKTDIFSKIVGGKWQEKQEKLMYDILLEKKKLNLAEIEQHKKPLQKFIDERNTKLAKLDAKFANREKIYEAAKKLLVKQTVIKTGKTITVKFDKDEIADMKQSYFNSYSDAEKDALKFVKSKPFRYIFDWNSMINEGKERRKLLDMYSCKANHHRSRYELKKLSKEYEGSASYTKKSTKLRIIED